MLFVTGDSKQKQKIMTLMKQDPTPPGKSASRCQFFVARRARHRNAFDRREALLDARRNTVTHHQSCTLQHKSFITRRGILNILMI